MSGMSSGDITTLTGNAGGLIPATGSGNFNIVGSGGILVTGNPATHTLTISGGAVVAITNHALAVGTGVTITSLGVGTTGTILTGVSGADPTWTTATYPSTVVLGDVLVASANNIVGVVNNVANAGYILTANVGAAPTFQAPPAGVTYASDAETIAGTVTNKAVAPSNLKAKLGLQTLHGLPIGASDSVAIAWTAEPTDGQILIGKTGNQPVLTTISSGNNITATAGAGTISIAVTGTTQHAVQIGDSAGQLKSLAVGANGETIMGSTSADCSWTSSPQFGGSVTALYDISSTAGSVKSLAGSIITKDATNTATGPNLYFQKSRVANPITSGDSLGVQRFTGYDGTGFITGAKITSDNSGTVATNRIAGNLQFYTHPDSVIALPSEPLLRMTIDSTGAITAPIVYSTTVGATAGVGMVDSTGLLGTLSGTSGQVLQGGTKPAFSTATYPSTVALGDVLVASANNIIGVVNNVANAGYVLTTNIGAAPSFQAIPSPVLMTWSREAGTPVTMAVFHGYIPIGGALTTFLLPATAVLGDVIEIVGESAWNWVITQNANQQIQFGNTATTVGVGGSLASSNAFDCVRLVCRVAGASTRWSVTSAVGLLNFV